MTKIVDANVWVTEPEMYSDNAGIMDQSMEAAGWKEKGLHKNTGVTTYKDGNLAASIGKKNFSDTKIKENYNAIMQTIIKEKPNGIKGDFILSGFLTSTMGVSYKLKLKG